MGERDHSQPVFGDSERRAVDLQFAFNLSRMFGKRLLGVSIQQTHSFCVDSTAQGGMPVPINTETALGICLIGNLGFENSQSRVPSLGFTDIAYTVGGIPCCVQNTKVP